MAWMRGGYVGKEWGRDGLGGQRENAQERAGSNKDKGLITKFIYILIVHLNKRKISRYDIWAYPASHRECKGFNNQCITMGSALAWQSLSESQD